MKLQAPKHAVLQTALAAAMLSGVTSHAQVLAPQLAVNKYPALIEEQYQQGHYAVAAQTAKEYVARADKNVPEVMTSDMDKARYYLTLAELKADVAGCAERAKAEIQKTQNTVYAQRIAHGLAKYYFQHDEYAKAIPLFEESGIANLENKEIADQKFELAYCYFNNKQFDKARPLLASIKELKDSKYYMAGNYYYGLLCYNENKYTEALRSFEKVKNEKEYRNIVPYYIAEIYYFMGDRAKALQQADSLLKNKEKNFYDKELHLLAAQCLFEAQQYKEAKPYFQFYYEHTEKIRKEELYEMAYTNYRIDDFKPAIEQFKMLSNAQDSLGQTAMYLLGDCYLKTGNKQSARNAYGISADMAYNKGQQEASMILYSRLSYETGYNGDALRQLKALISTFPNTQYRDEAQTMTSGLLIRTNNYEDALKHLKEVKVKDQEYKIAYQKATYGYGVQLYRSGELKKAYDQFVLSLKEPVYRDYECASLFWKSEIAYKFKDYKEVIAACTTFIKKDDYERAIEWVSPLATVQHAYLNMGYAAMALQDYEAAQDYFNEAQANAHGKDAYSASVAALHEADAVFMLKNYSKAISLYDKIIATHGADADYATYQKGILLGLQGKYNEKITLLQSLTKGNPQSVYAGNARYEIAVTYLEMDKNPQALAVLKSLADSVTDKSLAPKAWMKIGFIYQAANDVPKAIDAYKHVVTNYPAAEERPSALESLRSLYIQGNDPAGYSRLLRDNNLPSAESSSLDSTYYAAAETQFSSGKTEQARAAFSSYLQQYPNGVFALKAHYYRAESNFQLKKYQESRDDYNVVLSYEWNDFSENSARRAAGIATELKDYAGAFTYYQRLRANMEDNSSAEFVFRGLMKNGYNAGKYNDAVAYADTLAALPGIAADVSGEAAYYKAKALQQLNKTDEAAALYKQLAGNKNGEIAAEARYRIAEQLVRQDKLKEAEDAANESIKLSAGYDDWIGKTYLLLADILVKQKDYFNAKALLQSIVKHTKLADLKTEAGKKLEEVKKLEKTHSKLSEE